MTLNNIVDESVLHIIGTTRKFYFSQQLVEILNTYRELRIDGLIAEFLPLSIGACYWYKEIESKKYTRFKNKLSKHYTNFRGLKRDGYLKNMLPITSTIFQSKIKKSLSLVKKGDHIIKIYYYELYQLFKRYKIKNPKSLTDNIIFDLFNYSKILNIYKVKHLYHLSKKIYYYST